MLEKLNRALHRLPRAPIVATAALAVGLIGAVDHVTGYEISLSIFYLAPIVLCAWYAGAKTGYFMALFSSATWVAVDLSSGHAYSHPAIPFWDGGVHLTMFAVVVNLLSKLKDHLALEKQLARIDALTGIANRLTFMEQLSRSLDLAARARSSLTLAYIDADDFKRINDTDGHEGGDSVLRDIANTLQGSVRRTDVVARLGGDEFAVLMPSGAPLSTAPRRSIREMNVS